MAFTIYFVHTPVANNQFSEMFLTLQFIALCLAAASPQISHGLPVPMDSGNTSTNATSQQTLPQDHANSLLELNCSGADVSHSTYTNDLLQLSVGTYVLRNSSSQVYKKRASAYPTSADCTSPVEYTGIFDGGDQAIASWFSVFQSFTEYLESLLQSEIAERDANELRNMIALLDAVLREDIVVVSYL